MPNIFLYKNNNNKIINTDKICINNFIKKNNIDYNRHYPPANIEWKNSIYAYNKNVVRHLPFLNKMLIGLIKSYFNIFNPKIENKINFIEKGIKNRRFSINKIFVSNVELKHTNTNIIITIYIYNRQKKYFLNKLKTMSTIGNDNNLYLIKKIKLQSLRVLKQLWKQKNFITNLYQINSNWDIYDKFWNKYENTVYEEYTKKALEKEILKNIYEYLLYFNKSKFENTSLFKLYNLISHIFNKEIEFNIVNLEYLHLNSDILSESIAIKLRNRNNRLLQVLKTNLDMLNLPNLNKLSVNNNLNKIKYDKILSLNKVKSLNVLFKSNFLLLNNENTNDIFDQVLHKVFYSIINNKNKRDFMDRNILHSIKYKSISGIRLEAAGRLTRRLTAARSVFKFKYKGSLKNIDSSYKGYSSVILRGYEKSNIQYTNINSKTRNGSFGIKGWISSN